MARIRTSLALFAVVAFEGNDARAQSNLPKTEIEISERCALESKLECHDQIGLDGFCIWCYFEPSKNLRREHFLADRDKCFAYRNQSVFPPCANEFQINVQGKMKDVSCDEFYTNLRKNELELGAPLLRAGDCVERHNQPLYGMANLLVLGGKARDSEEI